MTQPAAGTPAIAHAIVVPRTARYYTLGGEGAVREVWLACHGYGQLAGHWMRHFEAIASPERLVVAPEALNRFYLGDDVTTHAHARVGATWMTREDRDHEIADQRHYLDAVLAEVRASLGGPPPRLVLFGFSQGVATITRWATAAGIEAARLVVWAGSIPAEVDLPHLGRLVREGITFVVGDADQFVTAERLASERERLELAGVRYRLIRFPGKHQLDREALMRCAD